MIDLSMMKGVMSIPPPAPCASAPVAHRATRPRHACLRTCRTRRHRVHNGYCRPHAWWSTGYLTRKYGLTTENLLEADVVLADGRIVTANKSENADLYWGLRGGGGNFGIVTSFLFQAHPVNMVYAGPIFWGSRRCPADYADVQGFPARCS